MNKIIVFVDNYRYLYARVLFLLAFLIITIKNNAEICILDLGQYWQRQIHSPPTPKKLHPSSSPFP